jgi:Tol biopolymer transport system component
LKAYGWSPDDAQVAFCEFIGNTTSKLWLVDVEKGEKRLLSGTAEKADGYYDSPLFSKDGKGIFVITDRGSDVRRLTYLNLASGQFKSLTAAINWDVGVPSVTELDVTFLLTAISSCGHTLNPLSVDRRDGLL